ncbi:gluconate 2-dehydrogenase subunit 3 family protein [Neokomagataea anthophila]|uniref:Gluconate 2-dehydrogenase subunit 3 family protein n=1 Tax=Neokomagataea anthophila TaxID=2826925 RepID=A0ABS5E8F3_9PROT|nr:gluconate 2-dehydrogenase subunit 3 family protein [Neokomagataea anthophila]MBR0560184.1 gluconate 2-dehydrogenase subunit 3 family protein [Neokomagataea anthophila]
MTTHAAPPKILQSDRISSRTRSILQARRTAPQTPIARTLSPAAYDTLTALVPALLPQDELLSPTEVIDLPHAIDRALTGPRDGWRFAELPSDACAWEYALLTIAEHTHNKFGVSPHALSLDQLGLLLDSITDGQIGSEAPQRLTAFQMQRWSSDFRADVIEAFLAHPHAQQALGISAYLNGDDDTLTGFHNVTPDTAEAFEPIPSTPLTAPQPQERSS